MNQCSSSENCLTGPDSSLDLAIGSSVGTATVEENGAGFTGVSEISPIRFPSLARRVPRPSPCIELWDILLDSGCLIPVEAGLQQCSFDVLNQCSMGGRQVLERLGTIREKVMSNFIYAAGTKALAVHDDDHMLQSLDMDVIVDLFRVVAILDLAAILVSGITGSGALAKSFQYAVCCIRAKFVIVGTLFGQRSYWIGRNLGSEGRWLKRPS
ncbi:unnamed protein product [Leuciscus chuanchicus]